MTITIVVRMKAATRAGKTSQRPERGLHVVETFAGDVHLGRVETADDVITVYTGYRGRPARLHRSDVSDITPAEEHPSVTATPGAVR